MKAILFLLLFTIKCGAIEFNAPGLVFNGPPVQYITNQFAGKSIVYRVDRRVTTPGSPVNCKEGDCKVDFTKAITAVDHHVGVQYGRKGIMKDSALLVTECSIFRFDFSSNWCYVIKFRVQQTGTGPRQVFTIPVLADGTIPVLK